MNTSLKGLNEIIATFECDTTLKKGVPVKISANNKVCVCSKGDSFCGITVSVNDNICAVQLKGYAEINYSGTTAPSLGFDNLAMGDSDTVEKVSTGGENYLITNIDTTNKIVGFIL